MDKETAHWVAVLICRGIAFIFLLIAARAIIAVAVLEAIKSKKKERR